MNNTVDKTIALAFGLMFALVIAVYYVGVTTDASGIGAAFGSLINGLTGRNAQGQFAAYPSQAQ